MWMFPCLKWIDYFINLGENGIQHLWKLWHQFSSLGKERNSSGKWKWLFPLSLLQSHWPFMHISAIIFLQHTMYLMHRRVVQTVVSALTAHNWQKCKRVFLTCPYHKIYRDEAVGLKSCKYTWKITIFVKMWNFGQCREKLIFCQ